MRVSASKRLLLVHAHPDDETINNGVTMAKYAKDGAQVTLVTCTRGEEGEVLVAELSNLASDKDDKLGQHREIELKDAMAHLGIWSRKEPWAPAVLEQLIVNLKNRGFCFGLLPKSQANKSK